MSRTIAFDLSRLLIGPLFRTPRGIDRVDLALASHIFADAHSPNLGVLPTPWGVRVFPAAYVVRLLVKLKALWSESMPEADDPAIRKLLCAMAGEEAPAAEPAAGALSYQRRAARMADLLRTLGWQPGRSAVRTIPHGAIYLNVGQLALAVPRLHTWLDQRPDLTRAIMLHDVIPLEYPHLVPRRAVAHHRRMVGTAARHATCLLFTTNYAREGVVQALRTFGRTDVPSFVRALPVPAAFASVLRSIPELGGRHYFIVVSTIEPRKNHALLIRVWRSLIRRHGAAVPDLVMVGSPGNGSRQILDWASQDPGLRRRIHHVSGLSSPSLAALMLGASATLSPSIVEGFGLPVFESLALGVPVIASDIPAHRELARADAVLLPLDDDAAWEAAILQTRPAPIRTPPAIPTRMTEKGYCEDVLAFLHMSSAHGEA